MLHSIIHWPDQADLALWPLAMQHAVYLWNHLPDKDSGIAPIEIFTGSKFENYAHLHRAHVWGTPVFVLEPTLQDGKKLPKWKPRSRQGMYVGVSPAHSTRVSLVLNLRTGHISPQYHTVHDDLFTTVTTTLKGNIEGLNEFDKSKWD
jgi:hypothetical protein